MMKESELDIKLIKSEKSCQDYIEHGTLNPSAVVGGLLRNKTAKRKRQKVEKYS